MVGAAHSMHSTEPGEMSVAAMTVSVYLPRTFRRNLFFAFASLAPAMRRIRSYVSYYSLCKCSRIGIDEPYFITELNEMSGRQCRFDDDVRPALPRCAHLRIDVFPDCRVDDAVDL